MNVNNISPPAKRIGSPVTLADCEKRVRFKEPKGDPATPESMIEKYVQASFATITKEKQWVDKEIKGKYPHQFLCSIVRGEYNEQLDGMTLKKIIEALQARGAEINATGNDGKTALHYAAQTGQAEAIKELINCGATTEPKDKYGKTVLHYAARSGLVEVIRVLVGPDAKTEATDENGDTALHVAAKYGQVEAIKVLINCDAKTEATDRNGKTALHWSALHGQVEAITVLIENGAEINATDDDGKTALQVASGYGHSEAIRILHLFAELSTDI